VALLGPDLESTTDETSDPFGRDLAVIVGVVAFNEVARDLLDREGCLCVGGKKISDDLEDLGLDLWDQGGPRND
jgi:hypothetical protein